MISKEDFKYQFEKKEEQSSNVLKKILFSNLVKLLIVCILFLGSLIYIKYSEENKENFKKVVYNNSLSFAKIYNIYQKYLGDVIPFKNTLKEETKLISSEKITYQNIEKCDNGFLLTVDSMYTVNIIKSGIVIEIKDDEKYKKIVTIQDKEGVNITYGFSDDISVSLYDYVEKGEILGISDTKLYLEFKKDGNYLSYEKYL